MNFEQLMGDILQDIRECQQQIASDKDGYFQRFPRLPPTIGLSSGEVIFVSERSVRAIRKIAHTYWRNSAECQRALSAGEMPSFVSRSIGTVLNEFRDPSTSQIQLPDAPDHLWKLVRAQFGTDLKEFNEELVHIFGGWIIQGAALPAIDVGPVRFSLRNQWLRDSIAAGTLTDLEGDRLSELWQVGGTEPLIPIESLEDLKLRSIFEAIGSCPWVCAVRVCGHSREWSLQKALIAARIAIAAISLAWHAPSQQAEQTGLLYDLGPNRMRHTVSLDRQRRFSAQHENVLRIGRFLNADDAAKFEMQSRDFLRVVGAVLDGFLSVDPHRPKRLMEDTISHSLIWFGEACNEPLKFMAVVKFAAALDTLAGGKGASGICKLVELRCAVADMDAPFLTDGTTAKQLVEDVYEGGRSRIVHGTRPRILEDVAELRVRAEFLATIVLSQCCRWWDTYTGDDDVGAFATSR